MSFPKRIQLSRAKGWRLPEGAVVVSRPTRFGNPWSIRGAREAGYTGPDERIAAWCVELYRELIEDRPGSTAMLKDADRIRTDIHAGLPRLRGRDLACWCALNAPCHADILLEIANG